MRARAPNVVLLCSALALGCTGGSEGGDDGSEAPSGTSGPSGDASADGSDTPPGDGSSASADTSAGDADGSDSGSDSGPGDTGTDTSDPPPPPAACEDVQLPARNGAQIVVAPAGAGQVTVDGQPTTLRSVVAGLSPGDTVLLQDGTYTFEDAPDGSYSGLYFTTPDVTLRSMGGDPSAVILDSAYVSHGGSSGTITIDAPGVVIAHITVQRSIFHLIHLWANGDGALVHDVHLVDGGQQFVKASPGDAAVVDGVEISCSSFTMTDAGRDNVWGYGPPDGGTQCYTGGIDTHDSTNWSVHDSYFAGIYCDASGVQRPAHGRFPELRDGMTYNGGLAEHCVHMWDSVAGTGHVIARNRFVDCARGIGLGFNDQVHGTSIVNNTVFSGHAGSGEHDVGISVEEGVDTLVAHNTVYFSHPDAYPNRVEYRFDTTSNLTVRGNLTNGAIQARDGAVADEIDNLITADGGWFVSVDNGDLHLADCGAPGSIAAAAEVPDDIDGEPRSDPTVAGADHCN